MENKNQENQNNIILGDYNCAMNKMDRYGGNKAQRFYRCCSNYALSKLIVDNGLEELWRKENPDSPEFTCYDRFFGKDTGQTGVFTDIKIAKNTKNNHIMVCFTDHYNAISIDRIPSKTKIGKGSWYFNNSFLYKPKFSSAKISF